MARGFFARFARFGLTETPESPPEALAPLPPDRSPALEDIAREIARQGLPPAPRKAAISLRVDADVLEWFKEQGPGYQTRINAVLRAYKEAAG